MMGVKSTVDITREDAIAEIRKVLNDATNDQIAVALEMLVGDERLTNYRIVDRTVSDMRCDPYGRNGELIDDEL